MNAKKVSSWKPSLWQKKEHILSYNNKKCMLLTSQGAAVYTVLGTRDWAALDRNAA